MGLLDRLRGDTTQQPREGITDNPLRQAVSQLLAQLGTEQSPLPSGVSGLLPLPILMNSAQAMLARTPDASLVRGVQAVRKIANQLAALAPSTPDAD